MRDSLTPVWSKQNKIAIACLGLVPLMISCSSTDAPELSSEPTTSNVPVETVVAEEPTATQPAPATNQPVAKADQEPIASRPEWASNQPAPSPKPVSTADKSTAPQSKPVPSDSSATSSPQSTPAVAVAPANSKPTTQVQNTIPFPFQGDWDASLEGCGVSYSNGKLSIRPNRIDFYESSGNVQAVTLQGERKMTVTAEYFGEGSTFTRTYSFELSSDRASITIDDPRSVRYRCPDPSSAVAAAPANSSPVAQTQSAIPMQFLGRWDSGLDGCDVPYSEGQLHIELHRINFYESHGNVQKVVIEGDLKTIVTAEYNGEGELYTETTSFELSSDRSMITRIDEDGFSSQYRRCSG